MYSLKLHRGAGVSRYRLLVEPGDPAAGVDQQIRETLSLIARLLANLGWSEAWPGLKALVRDALPDGQEDRDRLWGGLWLGAAVGESAREAELRTYVNLRYGNAVERWQRVADLLGSRADARLEGAVGRWIRRSASEAIPVGLGIAIRRGHVVGMRFYLGHNRPRLRSLAAVARIAAEDSGLDRLVRGFEDCCGEIGAQAATTGHDFPFRDGRLTAIGRAKVDLCCQLVEPASRPCLESWLDSLPPTLLGRPDGEIGRFRRDLREVFGGSSTEFVSAGFYGGSLGHLTIYERPAWPALN